MSESFGTLIGLAAFIIIMVVSKNAIEEALNITGSSAWLLAGCVAALALLGMARSTNDVIVESEERLSILFLYGAYGLACLLAILLGLLFKNPKRRGRFFRWFVKDDFDERMRK